jgi:hypothetical protein
MTTSLPRPSTNLDVLRAHLRAADAEIGSASQRVRTCAKLLESSVADFQLALEKFGPSQANAAWIRNHHEKLGRAQAELHAAEKSRTLLEGILHESEGAA